MRTILRRLFSRGATPDPGPRPRLSEREAAAIAERAAAASGRPGTTGAAHLVRVDGACRWDVCQVSIGSGWRIVVDDATGEAGPVGRWGIR